MDVTVQWRVSADVEKLVEAIVECRKLLIDVPKQKYNLTRVGVLECDVFAGDKVVELLQLSELCVPCADTEEDLKVPESRRPRKTSFLVADFTLFKLHRLPVMGEDHVRMVLDADVGDGCNFLFYGNVKLVTT
jgi:hypothetical protein